MHFAESSVVLDADVLQSSLEKRLRARVARADNAVDITPETLERWLQEEFASVLAEHAFARAMANDRSLN